MALFIANTTKQHHELIFWVPEQGRPFTKLIRAGTQENVYPEGTRDTHEYIVAQHRAYGLKEVSEIDRTKEFVGLCFQFDKHIPGEILNQTLQHNDAVMNEQAQARRMEATAALDDSLTNLAQESGSNLSNLEVEVVEEQKKGVETQINETIALEKPGRRSRRGQ